MGDVEKAEIDVVKWWKLEPHLDSEAVLNVKYMAIWGLSYVKREKHNRGDKYEFIFIYIFPKGNRYAVF